MINWELLYEKFGKNESSKRFEDMALEYVRKTYSEYEWKPTGRTRDGNRDFHNLENELLNIWGEAKYKKNSVRLTRKDLDPTILSGLIDGTVQLIIFVTNGYIPDSLITRMTLGANMKGIKLSFVTGNQLSDWLALNPMVFETFFEEKIDTENVKNEQIVEFRNVFFYEPVSLDFKPNYYKVSMNVDDTFIINCLIYNTKESDCKIELENNSPLSFIESPKYENPKKFFVKPGLNAIAFLVKARKEYNDVLRFTLICCNKIYNYVSSKITITKNNQLNIYYFNQIDILGKIGEIIKNYDNSMGNYIFFLHGNSGMGKSYILQSLSMEYCLNNDLTLVTFESNTYSNMNYLLVCRIIIFLLYGNVFWDHTVRNIKKFCFLYKPIITEISNDLLNNIINSCFDSNIAKTTIDKLVNSYDAIPKLINSQQQKTRRILMLDDLQYLNKEQSVIVQTIINQQINSRNNNIIILSARKNEFVVPSLEDNLLNMISNYYELDQLSAPDIEGTISENFSIKEKTIDKALIDVLPTNLLLLNEVLSNLKFFIVKNKKISNTELINSYVILHSDRLVFQEKFSKLKDKYYILDIIYLFKQGINQNELYSFFSKDKNAVKKDILLLKKMNCIKQLGKGVLCPFHDYLVENYRKLRKGKEYNEKTGAFIKYLLDKKSKKYDINILLSTICKCGKNFYKDYSKYVQNLMVEYISKSEYGAALFFAELFYEKLKNKKKLTRNDKYCIYLYADCLVHCDNKYRAKQLLNKIADSREFASFEKYEALVSLLNQRFWNIDLEGVIEDSKMYQIDLESMFMDNLSAQTLVRFKKAYESCFNRRMVTLLLLDKYEEAQESYRDGLFAIKSLSQKYNLTYNAEIATIIMDYARGNMTKNPLLSYTLLNHAANFFKENRSEYIRRTLICQIDIKVSENVLGKKVNYQKFMQNIKELDQHHFLLEYIKGLLKIYVCRMIDYSRINHDSNVSNTFINESMDSIQKVILNKQIVLEGRELYLFNYLLAYYYVLHEEYSLAKACIKDNTSYIKNAGKTYRIPLEHNLKNLETIQNVEWFQEGKSYSEKTYIIDSRFW